MFLSNDEFTVKTKAKLSHIKQFKKSLLNSGLIVRSQQLSDDFIPVFEEARSFKFQHRSTWDHAFKVAITPYVSKNTKDDSSQLIIELLNEILLTLRRIEEIEVVKMCNLTKESNIRKTFKKIGK